MPPAIPPIFMFFDAGNGIMLNVTLVSYMDARNLRAKTTDGDYHRMDTTKFEELSAIMRQIRIK